MASPTFLARGHTPTRSDTKWFIEQRILGALIDGGGGGATDITIGVAPNPNGVITGDPGSAYVDRVLHTYWIKETGTGNTGWMQYV